MIYIRYITTINVALLSIIFITRVIITKYCYLIYYVFIAKSIQLGLYNCSHVQMDMIQIIAIATVSLREHYL